MAVSVARNTAAGAENGHRIGRYRVRARLGKGGMGVVYLGKDEALDRDVAIKTLRVDGSNDDESRGRFEIEARAAARLQHPNIVTVFELGEDRGLPFIAMELLGGQDLEALVRSGERVSVAERLDIVIQTLRGLDFAHAHQIVHRDMKPSNIRVLDDGGVKILDFGIAKVESTSVTRAGMMVGTPFYMSPEHIRGGVLDGRSDVFAIGVILHELFALRRPFTAEDPTRVMYRIVGEPHPKLKPDAAGALTPEVQRVIDRALEKEADNRFNSAAAMADELCRVRERQPAAHLSADDMTTLGRVRRRLSTHPGDTSLLEAVEAIALSNAEVAEAQRLLRQLRRKPLEIHATGDTASFPELDATFGRPSEDVDRTIMSPPTSGQTIRGNAETIASSSTGARAGMPTAGMATSGLATAGMGSSGMGATGIAPVPQPRTSNTLVYVALGTTLALGIVAAYLYVNRPHPGETSEAPAQAARAPEGAPVLKEAAPVSAVVTADSSRETSGDTTGAAAVTTAKRPATAGAPAVVPKMTLEIRSAPAGAAVRLDRKQIGVTPLKVEVVSNTPHALSLSLAGHNPKDLRLDLPIPAAIDVTLTPSGPPATLVVESAYPVTVSAGGRVISSNKPGVNATLPSGTQEIVVESAAIFLKMRETVRLESGGSVSIQTPGVGKIGVRASPDNCKVFVDGIFVDYPPILDRAIAAGNHVLSFEWPDGARHEERIVIQAGRPAYFQGRKP
jgi:serine/threonine protein kinase